MSYFTEKTEATGTSASPTTRISAHIFNLPSCYCGWTSRSLFKATSTCYLDPLVISPGTLLLSAASTLSSVTHHFHQNTYVVISCILTSKNSLNQTSLSALFHFSASFMANSWKECLYLLPPILLSPFSTVVRLLPPALHWSCSCQGHPWPPWC